MVDYPGEHERRGPKDRGKARSLVLLVIAGNTVAGAAKLIGVPLRTARRWSRDPRFRLAVEEGRSRALDAAIGRLTAGATGAVDALIELAKAADSDATRVSAAKAILSQLPMLAEFHTLAERVRVLEERAKRTEESQPWQ